MVFHEQTWNHGRTLVGAWNCVVLACVEMGLEFAQFVRPLAPLLVVDAENCRTHDNLFCIGVRVDLCIVQWKPVFGTCKNAFTGQVMD
jgi:hypothetical protein